MIPIPLRWLTAAAGLMAALLGVLMLLGGLGMGSAAFITQAPQQNREIAMLLTVAGLCNAGCSFWIWRANLVAVMIGSVASLAVAAYFALRIDDIGETFWLHLVLLVLLTLVGLRLVDMRKGTPEPHPN